MLLNFHNGEPFATGSASYRYDPVPGSGDASRIIVQVEVDGDSTEAILDTGGGYFFCKPELADSIDIDPDEAIGSLTITIRKVSVKGTLYRIPITLLRDKNEIDEDTVDGEDLALQVTAFFPDPDQGLAEDFLPYSYLGMHCCMERVRFAIDPSRNEDRFYFGECSG